MNVYRYNYNHKFELNIPRPDGVYELLWDSGSIYSRGIRKDGLLEGTWTRYNENGILVEQAGFHKGRLHGTRRSYYDNGIMSKKERYEDGKLILRKLYHQDGRPYSPDDERRLFHLRTELKGV